MAAKTPDIATGLAITFDSGFFTGHLTSVNWSGIERQSIPTSTLATAGGKTYMVGDLYDPGELTVEMHFASDDDPPILTAAETVTITFADAQTWACSGFMTGFEWTGTGGENEELLTAVATIKLTGSITYGP